MEKAQGAQVVISRSEDLPVSFQDDRLKSIKIEHSTDIELRVIVDGKEGHSSVSDMSDIDSLVEMAVETAKLGSPAYFEFPKPQKAYSVKTYDESLLSLTRNDMLKIGEETIAVIKEYNSRIIVSVDLYKEISSIDFANSSGLEFSVDATLFSAGCTGQLIHGNNILEISYGKFWRNRNVVDHKEIARNVVEKFKMARRKAKFKSGAMTVVFAPEAVGILLLPLRLGFSGKNVLLGSSPLAGRIGERVFDPKFTLIDNPLIDYAADSNSYDDEGVPHQINTLVKDGVVQEFLYDLDTAGRAGKTSTGNGIGCGTTNLIIQEGGKPYSDLIGSISEGLLVYDVIGLGQSNVINGEFSVNVNLGYKIENGEIAGRIKDVMLTGNAYTALANITAIGSESEWVDGSLKTPAIQVEKLNVTA